MNNSWVQAEVIVAGSTTLQLNMTTTRSRRTTEAIAAGRQKSGPWPGKIDIARVARSR